MDTLQQGEIQLEAPKEIANITQEKQKMFKVEDKDDILQVSEPSLQTTESAAETAEENEDTGAVTAAQEPLNEEIREPELPHPLIAPIETNLTGTGTGTTVLVAQTTEPVTQGPSDPSHVPPVSSTIVSGTAVSSGTLNPEEIKHMKEEGSKEAELPDPLVTATLDSSTDARPGPGTETVEEDEGVEFVKEEIKEAELPDATPVGVSDAIVRPIAEPSKETQDAEHDHEEETKEVKSSQASPATETVEELANLELEATLSQVETEGPRLLDASVAATGEEENKESELVKEEVHKSELPDSSVAAAQVIDTELMPGTQTSEATAVVDVHTQKEKASDEVKADAAESADAEREVAEVLPEKKKKKKPLGDHLAEEKANDSVNATKRASDENSKGELPGSEQITGAVAPKESTEISVRDASSTDGTIIKKDEKEEDKQAVENATGEVTATEVAQLEGQGEKLADRSSGVATEEGAKEDQVASKLTPRSSNNILSKVKHQIVKVKKAIVRRSVSSKNMPVENKVDIKVE